jgi:hypothetical protein
VIEMAMIGGAWTAHLYHNFGTLSPVKKADIIMLAADRINVFPLNNVPDTVVTLMDTTNVDTVFVAGRVVKWSSLTSAGCADWSRSLATARSPAPAIRRIYSAPAAGLNTTYFRLSACPRRRVPRRTRQRRSNHGSLGSLWSVSSG